MRAQLPCSRSRSLPPTATLNGIGFPDPRRLPSTRNRAGSSRSVPSIFQDGTTDHHAPSPIADSPRRARPCPPLSAATESGFLGQAPLADFCNHFSQSTGTPSDRPFLARSSPFRRSSLPRVTGAASGTAPDCSFGAARLASEDAGRTGRKAPSQLLRAVAPEADSNTCRAPPVIDLPCAGPVSFPALRACRPRPGSDLPRERLRPLPSRGAWDRLESKQGR